MSTAIFSKFLRRYYGYPHRCGPVHGRVAPLLPRAQTWQRRGGASRERRRGRGDCCRVDACKGHSPRGPLRRSVRTRRVRQWRHASIDGVARATKEIYALAIAVDFEGSIPLFAR
ncbi:hypothetical protein HK100_007847, partial [Physocladia obscura]